MTYKKIVLAGGSGYIGSVLIKHFAPLTDSIIVLSRGKAHCQENVEYVPWDGQTLGDWASHIEDADLLVNLTGKNVNCRYTATNRRLILNSRINAIKVLGQAIQQCSTPPKSWIQCASANIYRHAEDRPMDEDSGEIGTGFSVRVCLDWERSFEEQKLNHTRKALLRVGIVMGLNEGVFPRLATLAKWGLGGKQGDGNQMVSWIHESDMANMIQWIHNNKISGTFNATAPQPIKNKDQMRIVRTEMGIPFGLPAPTLLLNLGAWIIGTEPELILKSRWAIPKRLVDLGFKFECNTFEEAIKKILSNKYCFQIL